MALARLQLRSSSGNGRGAGAAALTEQGERELQSLPRTSNLLADAHGAGLGMRVCGFGRVHQQDHRGFQLPADVFLAASHREGAAPSVWRAGWGLRESQEIKLRTVCT
eukprot:SAG31_NODE_22_length_33849_cov_13.713096_11_plen_108_part_00